MMRGSPTIASLGEQLETFDNRRDTFKWADNAVKNKDGAYSGRLNDVLTSMRQVMNEQGAVMMDNGDRRRLVNLSRECPEDPIVREFINYMRFDVAAFVGEQQKDESGPKLAA